MINENYDADEILKEPGENEITSSEDDDEEEIPELDFEGDRSLIGFELPTDDDEDHLYP